jgi:undecaprenyl-diphosphatase
MNPRRLFWLAVAMASCLSSLYLSPVWANPGRVAAATGSVNIIQAAILGFVQGATEFLPISSSAHLKVVPVVLGWGDPGVSFTAIIQLGSIVAVIWYFWADLYRVVTGSIRSLRDRNYQSTEFRMAAGIVLGTLPIIVGGLLIKRFVPDFDRSPLRSMSAIAIASIFMSLLLSLAETIGKRKRNLEQVTVIDGILMGVGQALALIPGCSRSGSTLTAGLFTGLERAAAARFSFLLGVPSITLAGLVELKDVIGTHIPGDRILSLIVGTISAGIFSYLAIEWLLKFLQNQSTWVFVWYRLIFGSLILIGIFAFNWLPNT